MFEPHDRDRDHGHVGDCGTRGRCGFRLGSGGIAPRISGGGARAF